MSKPKVVKRLADQTNEALEQRLARLEAQYDGTWSDVDFLKRRSVFFSGHYTAWQEKRVTHILNRFDPRWLRR